MRHRKNDTVLIGSFYYWTILLHKINFCELDKICISNIGWCRFFSKNISHNHEYEMVFFYFFLTTPSHIQKNKKIPTFKIFFKVLDYYSWVLYPWADPGPWVTIVFACNGRCFLRRIFSSVEEGSKETVFSIDY